MSQKTQSCATIGRPPRRGASAQRVRAAVPAPLTAAGSSAAARAAIAARWRVLLLPALLAGGFLWSYWPIVRDLVTFWSRNQDYSVGLLIPPTALALAWRDRGRLRAAAGGPCWWGLAVLVLAELLRQAGAYYGVATAERCALWVALVGVLLMAAGSGVVRRAVWLLAFLLLMIPPPARLHEAIALPLQRLASGLTTAALELLGFYAQCEGNVIRLEDQTALNVAEACSGLRLLTAFVFVAALLAFLVRRPAWQKAVLLAASLPIAVLCNAARGVATALFAHYSPSAGLTGAFHDAAGLAMMPVALFLSLALFRYLALFTPARKPAAAAPGRDGNGPLRRAS